MRNSKLGDEMPPRRNVKWGAMEAGESHLSEEWHDMQPSNPLMSEKWVEQVPSSGHMSDKWVGIEAGNSELSDKWHEMKQEGRKDPYSMAPSDNDRAEASMKKQSSNPMKNSGHGRYEISGSEGQSGKGL